MQARRTLRAWSLFATTTIALIVGCADGGSSSDVTSESGSSTASITITQPADAFMVGDTVQLVVHARTTTGSTSEVTDTARFELSGDRDALVEALCCAGRYDVVGTGSVQVTAFFDGFEATANLLISEAAVANVEITGVPSQVALGLTSSVTVLATFDNGDTVDVSTSATVTTTDPTVASILDGPTLFPQSLGTTLLRAEFGGIVAETNVQIVAPAGLATALWNESAPSSTAPDSGNFFVAPVGDRLGITVDSPNADRTYHLASPGALSLSNYVFTGRMKTATTSSGVGVTFYSNHPESDVYYRLRTVNGGAFEIDPRLTSVNGGNRVSNVFPTANVWFRFRVHVLNQTDRTEIRARIWRDGDPEPPFDQIECFASTGDRRTSGTIGLWSTAAGLHSWADLQLNGVPVPLADDEQIAASVGDSTLDLEQSTTASLVQYRIDGSLDVTPDASFVSSDSGVVEIQNDNSVVGVSPGSATIVAGLDGETAPPVLVVVAGAAPAPDPDPTPDPTPDPDPAPVPDPVPTPDPSIPDGYTTSLSQNGITWTFAEAVPYGQFVNGDYWIEGPAEIVSINPPSLNVNGRIQHGSQINPVATDVGDSGTWQAYDNTLYGGHGPHYDHSKNVAFGVSGSNPLTVTAGDSLVSSITHNQAGVQPGIRAVAILTTLDSPPPEGSFRPPYYDVPKSLYTLSAMDLSMLQSYAPTAGMPSWADVTDRFARVWFEQAANWLHSFEHPSEHMEYYGRDMQRDVSVAACMLNTDAPLSTKMPLVIGMLQVGIDSEGFIQSGGYWSSTGGGISCGRKFPVVFKRKVFGENLPIDNPQYIFMEDAQTFIVQETSPGVYNYGQGGYGPGQEGMPEWGWLYWTTAGNNDNPPFPQGSGADGWSWQSGNSVYRRCCNYISSAGWVLAIRMMGMIDDYGWDASIGYQDRYMVIEPPGQWHRQWDPWTESMWDTYRPGLGGYNVPANWIPADAP